MSKPAIFLSSIKPGFNGQYSVQVYRGVHNTKEDVSNPANWEIIYIGTEHDCERFSANMHHAIDPNMADKFNPRQDVKRKIEL
jgi:hypothetical protein